jgi:flagellar FliL protein
MATDTSTRIASPVSRPAEASKGGRGAAPGGNDEQRTKKKKSMKLKIAAAVVLLLVIGAAAKFTVLAPSKASASTSKTKPKPALGPVVAMDELTLNLDGGHFLRLKLSIQTTKGTSAELDLTEGMQATIDEFSNRPVDELTGVKARTATKNELLNKLQRLYPKKIVDIFYTEFVMQ